MRELKYFYKLLVKEASGDKPAEYSYIADFQPREDSSLIRITKEEWDDHIAGMKVRKEPSQKVLIRKQINVLKNSLAESDYKAIKFAEGVMSAEEYAPIKAERQAARDRINELEAQLANM